MTETEWQNNQPVMSIKTTTSDPTSQLDSSTHRASMYISGGGVGRNICEAMSKLGGNPTLISVVGQDPHADFLEKITSQNCFKRVLRTHKYTTAQYIVLCDSNGECKMGLGDMDIFQLITPELIRSNEDLIKSSPILILDANLSHETLSEAMRLATKHNIPVFYEPTDLRKAGRIFQVQHNNRITFMSPNIIELRNIAKTLNINHQKPTDNLISEMAELGKLVASKISSTIIVTLGSKGILIVSQRNADEPYFEDRQFLAPSKSAEKIYRRLYPTIELNDIVNVNGAGDCWSSGFIMAMLAGLTEEQSVAVAFKASREALYAKSSVPERLFQLKDINLSVKAPYELLF